MPVARLLVDGAHLLACAGRCIGRGARARDAFDQPALLAQIRVLLPAEHRAASTTWFDGAVTAALAPGTRPEDVELVLVPVQGGRQRGLEVAVLRATLDCIEQDVEHVYLVGDPLRHEQARQLLLSSGTALVDIGVSYGEPTPLARRWWLRRPEVERCALGGTAVGTRKDPRAYRPPRLVLRHTTKA